MNILKVALSLTVLTFAAATVALAFVASFGQAQSFIKRRVLPHFSKAILTIHGVRVEIAGFENLPEGQCIFVANHRSTLDILVVTSLGFGQIRYFLSQKTRILLPVWAIAGCIKTFFTPPQTQREKRIGLFKRAYEELSASGDSAFLTPEGTRIQGPTVGKFNKGAFHLALALRAPVVPLYIYTPDAMNPGRKWRIKNKGVVRVTMLPAVCTEQWRMDSLETHIDQVRELYLAFARA